MSGELAALKESLGLEKYQRHIFLCADQTEPKCAPKRVGLESWEFLKRRLKELNLVGPQPLIYRSKVNCLRICTRGPIAVVYPEGVWYHSCTPEVLERIIQEHLVGGKVLETYAFARNTRGQPGAILRVAGPPHRQSPIANAKDTRRNAASDTPMESG